METYPGYRDPPHPIPKRSPSSIAALKTQAKLGMIVGALLCVGGAYAMIRRECTMYFHDTDVCMEVGYPFAGVGMMAIIIGIVIIVLSVFAMLSAHKLEAPQPLQVGSPCPTCKRPLVWIPQYERWFCQHCQRYA